MIDSTVEDGSSASNNRKLTDSEIIRYSITFMLAGYETTANALSYTSYLLALNPEIQRQLQEEIDNFYAEHPVREKPCVCIRVCLLSLSTGGISI